MTTTKHFALAALLGLAAPVVGAAPPTATRYQAIDLNPALDPMLGVIGTWAYGVGGGQQGGAYTWGAIPSWKSRRAMLWTGSAASAIDLNPAAFTFSSIVGVGGGQQVGWGNVYYVWSTKNGGGGVVDYYHAVLWTGTAESAVDLNPAGFAESWASGTDGAQQVGSGQIQIYSNKNGGSYTTHSHALLWTGSAASAVDLNPGWLGCTDSSASGVAGGQQVGRGHIYYYVNKKVGYVDEVHAILWTGSAASAVDLHPAAFDSSGAGGVAGGQQVGYGAYSDGTMHALLWTGSAASAVDLHSAAFTSSGAYGTNGGRQVGWGVHSDGTEHALVWTGSPASAVDLNTFLPTGFTDAVATGVDAAGNIVGYAWGPASFGNYHAFLWQPK